MELLDLPQLYRQSDYLTLHVAATPETQGMLSREAFAQMKDGVRIVNCARGELVDEAALAEALASGKVGRRLAGRFQRGAARRRAIPLFALDGVLATPHIGGSTEEAQEIVGVRIAEQVVEYLKHGVAINAVNMPAMSPEQYKALSPYATLADRLGNFAAHIASGNPHTVRLHYFGKIADNAHQPAAQRGTGRRAEPLDVAQGEPDQRPADRRTARLGRGGAPRQAQRPHRFDPHRLETDLGVTTVEGAVVLDKPRLLQVDGIYCEAALCGFLIVMKNQDVPGVIGHVGTVLGKNSINIANFSLGRREGTSEAVALVSTDELVPESVLAAVERESRREIRPQRGIPRLLD